MYWWLPLAVYASLFVVLLVATVRRPSHALVGVLCLYGIKQWALGSSQFLARYPQLTNYLVGGLVLVGLAVRIANGANPLSRFPKVGLPILCLYAYAFASGLLWSPMAQQTIDSGLAGLPYLVLLIFVAPLLVEELADLTKLYELFVVFGTAVVGLLMFTVDWQDRCVALAGPQVVTMEGALVCGNPLATAQLAGYVLLATVSLQLHRGASSRTVVGAGVVLSLLLIVRSGSRGQLLSAVVCFFVIWPLAKQVKNVKAFLAIAGGALLLSQVVAWGLRLFWGGSERWTGAQLEDATDGRLTMAMALLRVWQQDVGSILFGLGNSASFDPRIIGFYPHVMPLEVLGEEGVLGFCLLLIIVVSAYKSALRAFGLLRQDRSGRAALATTVGLCSFELLLSMKQGSLLLAYYTFMTVMLIGRIQSIVESSGSESVELDSGISAGKRPSNLLDN